MYFVSINKKAKKKLLTLPKTIKVRLAESIYILGQDPEDQRLDIKCLIGSSLYRLRIGNWRVLFTKHEEIKIIIIEKIATRGNVYK